MTERTKGSDIRDPIGRFVRREGNNGFVGAIIRTRLQVFRHDDY